MERVVGAVSVDPRADDDRGLLRLGRLLTGGLTAQIPLRRGWPYASVSAGDGTDDE